MEKKAGDLVTFARGQLLRQIAAASERIWLASPYLTAPIAKQICQAAVADERRLLTALVPDGVQVGALSPRALEMLHDCEFEIRTRPNLHAKVSLVDASWGLVGSGNLTNAGLGSTSVGNEELGVLLTEAQIEAAAEVFAGWWETAKPVTAAMIEAYAALPRIKRATVAIDPGPPLELPETEALDLILAEDAATASSRRYWIKSAFHQPDDERWWRRNWISDAVHARYEVGDLVFIYLTKQRNRGPGSCPALLRVIAPARHDPRFMAKHGDAGAAGRWPYVTETSVVAQVPVPAGVSPRVAGRFSPQRYSEISRSEFERMAVEMRA